MPIEENAVNGAPQLRAANEAAPAARLATAIIDVTRELKRSVPAPRAAPYFGLDIELAYDPGVLESLSFQGIFRKYELVLLVGSGLGGEARWLSLRLGCRILGVEPDVARTRSARRLSDAATIGEQVSFSAGEPAALPFRERVFTHVWLIDPTPRQRAVDVLAEAFRVLRSGAHFAAQIPATRLEDVAAVQEALATVGFVDINARAATMLPPSHTTTVARRRLQSALRGDEDLLPASGRGELRHPSSCSQLFCKRP